MAQWLGTGPFLVLRQYCRVYYTTVVVNFALFSEKFSKKFTLIFQYEYIVLICNTIQNDCAAIFIFFENFSENSAKTGSGVVIYLHIIMTPR